LPISLCWDHPRPRRAGVAILAVLIAAATVSGNALLGAPSAYAAAPSLGLGTSASFAILAGTAVNSTGISTVSGDIGTSPGTTVTGFPPGQITNGSLHTADATAVQAQADLTAAYNDAAARTPTSTVIADLGGQTLPSGVHRSATALTLTGMLTLDGQDDPNAVFILQATALTTAPKGVVRLVRGAQACNVFWQVGGSVTLGDGTTFVGTAMALDAITVQTGTTVTGRVLARNGAVALDASRNTRPTCAASGPAGAGGTDGAGGTGGTGGAGTGGAGGSNTGDTNMVFVPVMSPGASAGPSANGASGTGGNGGDGGDGGAG
jgi:hypothetical protein